MLFLLTLLACDAVPPPTVQLVTPNIPSPDTGNNAAAPRKEEEPEEEPPEPAVEGQNRAPRVRKAAIEPEKIRSIDSPKVTFQASDPDGDGLRVSISWYANGEKLLGQSEETLDERFIKKGDVLYAEVAVSDGRKEVIEKTDEVTITNSPPEIQMPRFGLDKLDGFKVPAKDPDGDKLSYRVEEAPPGLTISEEGVLSYEASMDVSEGGNFPTRIIAEDPDGEYAAWEMKISLNPSKPGEKKPAKETSGEDG